MIIFNVIFGIILVATFGAFIATVVVTAHLSKFCTLLLIYHIIIGLIYFIHISIWIIYIFKKRKQNKIDDIIFTPLRSSIKYNDSNNNNSNNKNNNAYSDDDINDDNDDVSSIGSHPIVSPARTSSINQSLLYGETNNSKKTCCQKCLYYTLVMTTILFTLMIWGLFGFIIYCQTHTLPKTSGEINLPGIQQPPIYIKRNNYGIIHVEANNEHDLMFGQAVAHAQDRLWQCEFQRRVAQGRLSEIVGSGALEVDKMSRTLGIYRVAKENFKYLNSETQNIVNAYCEGFNSYLNSNPHLPFEFILFGIKKIEPWTPADVISWAKMMSLDLSLNMNYELQRFEWVMEQKLSWNRTCRLQPPYDYNRFPIALSDADVNITDNSNVEPYLETCNNYNNEVADTMNWVHHTFKTNEKKPKLATKMVKSFLTFMKSNLPTYYTSQASNNWVVSGEKTETGFPFLANDPHLQLMAPSIWILMHLHNRNSKSTVVGSSFVGTPTIILGRNNHIAYGITNTGADVQDLYIMNESADGNQYEYNDKMINYTLIDEIIKVKHGDDYKLRIKKSIYGPVVTDIETNIYDGHIPLCLNWTSLSPFDTTLDALVQLNKAKNYKDFNNATNNFLAPVSNMVYADVENNIAYKTIGRVPMRRHSGLFPVPGNGKYNWLDFVPLDNMPKVLNPKEGFIVTANNQITPNNWPNKYRIAIDWDSGSQGYRALRITQLIEKLSNSSKLTMNDMKNIQNDYYSLLAVDFVPILDDFKDNELTSSALYWKKRLLNWNFYTNVGSEEASIFEKWFSNLATLKSITTITKTATWSNAVYLYRIFRKKQVDPMLCANINICLQLARDAFEKAVNDIGRYGYGTKDLHQALFKHQILGNSPLACLVNRKVAHGGDLSTVNVGGFNCSRTDLTQTHGASYRQIIDLHSMKNSIFINPLGQSGNILSKNYDNLLDLWSSGEYLLMSNSHHNKDNDILVIN